MTDEEQTTETPDEDSPFVAPDGADDEESAEDEDAHDAAARDAAPAMTQGDVEKRMRALDNEAMRHGKRVADIMGDDFALLIPSPIDWTPGFLFDPSQMPLPPEAVAALDALLGRSLGAELRDDDTKETCDRCAGLGLLRTGSKVQNQDVLPCQTCLGQGWVNKAAMATNVTPITPGSYAPNVQQGAQPVTVVRDPWGREQGQAHFGLDPNVVGW